MSLGIRNSFRLAANQQVAASTVLVVMTGMQFNLAASQKAHIRGNIPFSVGATGGYKFQIVSSQSLGNFINDFTVTDTVTPATIVGVQTSSAAFANALAAAGNHFLNFECDIVNGATAGVISLQFACNSAANAITALQGAWMDVVFL